MRHRRRRRLRAGFGATLGLCAATLGCQSARPTTPVAATPVVTIGAPVASPTWTARAASPGGGEVCWHAAGRSGEAAPGDLVSAGFLPTDSAGGPEAPEGKKADARKDGTELPSPHPLPTGGPVVQLVPMAHAPDVPRELAKQPLPPYVIEPPDVLLVEAVPREGPLKNDQQIRGQHLVRPDGTIGLGIYGSAFVGGLTIEQARAAIVAAIRKRVENFDIRDLNVDVLAYNSKFYYVVTDGGGYGEQVYPFPITGSETVLDALGGINGLPPVADKRKVWVARRGPGNYGQVLPVDWCGIVQRGGTDTNYQLMPGDRIYVKADHWISTDAWIGKRLSPIERLFGASLLGSQTVNSIRNNTTTTTP